MVLGTLTPRYADWCCLAGSERHNHASRAISPAPMGGTPEFSEPAAVSVGESLTSNEKGSW